jgi:drug/metabolite transporter (DMT)-like permease
VRPQHLAVLLVLSVIWGSAFMLVKVILDEDVPPLTLVAGRVGVAAIALAVAVIATGRSFRHAGAGWRDYLVMGVANTAGPFVLLTWGQEHVDSSLAAILVASLPLFTVVLAHYWVEERLTIEGLAGVLIGFAGVFLLIGGDLRDLTGSSTLGELAIIAGAFGYAIGTVYSRAYLREADPPVIAMGQMLVATVVVTPIAFAVEQPFDMSISAKAALAWVALGLLASAVAYLLFYWLIQRITATQASMVSYLIPIWAVLLGSLVLDEDLASTSIGGLALIIAGVWVVNGGGRWLYERFRGGSPRVEALRGGSDGPPVG